MNSMIDGELDSLERLATQIRDAARDGDLDALDERLRRRRALLDRLADRVQKDDPPSTPAEGARARLAAILEIDRDAERFLEEGRAALVTRLGAIADGRRGLRGYAAGTGGQGKRVDERG